MHLRCDDDFRSHRLCLQVLRLLGDLEAFSQQDLKGITALQSLTRLVLDSGHMKLPVSCDGTAAVAPAFKRALEGLMPGHGGCLEVLDVRGPLAPAMRACLRSSKRLRALRFGQERCTVFDGVHAPRASTCVLCDLNTCPASNVACVLSLKVNTLCTSMMCALE